jgi:hypothetical protein
MYASLKEAQADFDANKDFFTPSGRVTNRADLIAMGECKAGEKIQVRYGKGLTKTNQLTV